MALITLSSDFEKQSYGCGAMEAVISLINPNARVIHWMHGIEAFNLLQGARSLETVIAVPLGIHVCVVDPGVGTKRRGIVIETRRGDFLIGPDNGLLRPAARVLGGVVAVHELTNPKLQRQPVSPIFHGRDVFAVAAGYLSAGIPPQDFGPVIREKELVATPYQDAVLGKKIEVQVIHINKFGTPFFNLLQSTWDQWAPPLGKSVTLRKGSLKIELTHVQTFGEVPAGRACILKDDFTRIEAAVNQGSLVKRFPLKIGDPVQIQKE